MFVVEKVGDVIHRINHSPVDPIIFSLNSWAAWILLETLYFLSAESKDLHDMIRKFFLRRTKDLIANQLPYKGGFREIKITS